MWKKGILGKGTKYAKTPKLTEEQMDIGLRSEGQEEPDDDLLGHFKDFVPSLQRMGNHWRIVSQRVTQLCILEYSVSCQLELGIHFSIEIT
jgi:hypothetical protein